MKQVDLNCDMGEGIGNDEAIMAHISSANIACGFHAGNASIMNSTIDLALRYDVAIGAHPSFYDPEGFGRRDMQLSEKEIYEIVVYQVAALNGFVKIKGAELHHVKPHGALYNMAAKDQCYAKAIVAAVKDISADVMIYGLAGSKLIIEGKKAGMKTCSEVFADRTYQDDGSLTPRAHPEAVISEFERSLKQVKMMIEECRVETTTGNILSLDADTICIHGDHPGAEFFAEQMKRSLSDAGFSIKAP